MTKRINFILPFKPRRPAGGFRVMFEYANRFASKGYHVHLTFPIETPHMKYRFPYWMRKLISSYEKFDKDKWFDFHPSITMSYVPRVAEQYVEDSDIIIATWWSTVLEVSKLSEQKGRKINLIQGYEDWEGHKDLLFQSYDLPNVENVVVAKYLQNIVEQHTKKKALLIPNAISAEKFYLKNPIEDRVDSRIVMTYSEQEIKGSKYGLEALQRVKQEIPELKVDFFGVYPSPEGLPNWITYHRNPPKLEDLYNDNAIILSNSLTEGFPLTPAEGMFCGCALICTDIDGHREYAVDGVTALLVPVKDVETLTQKILQLINDDALRIRLAKTGSEHIKQFSWDNSFGLMESKINQQ